MKKQFWYGTENNKVRFFDSDPSGQSNVSNIGQAELDVSNNNLDIVGGNGDSLITCLHQAQQTTSETPTQA